MPSRKRTPNARKTSLRTVKTGDKRGKNPNSLANLTPWKAGDPSPNPSGKPKLLGESYKEWLAKVIESPNNPDRLTNAEQVARAMGTAAMTGDVSAAREMRSATEGEKITLATWQSEFVAALKAGQLTPQEVIDELGLDEAKPILLAAGQVVVPPASATESAGEHRPTRTARRGIGIASRNGGRGDD